jgi:hypothetical protein
VRHVTYFGIHWHGCVFEETPCPSSIEQAVIPRDIPSLCLVLMALSPCRWNPLTIGLPAKGQSRFPASSPTGLPPLSTRRKAPTMRRGFSGKIVACKSPSIRNFSPVVLLIAG